ncbi:hypothetical protein C8F01DRAFT_695527 [Mycena amicta]|nr:hypothetical protein C8F01DRAFT_695527 [Mycena amicta]
MPAAETNQLQVPSLYRDDSTVNELDQRSTDGGSFEMTDVREKPNGPQAGTEGSSAADEHGLQSTGSSSHERSLKIKASLVTILGTVFLQAVPWILFAVMWSKGPFPLPYIPTPLGNKAFTYVGSAITGGLASLSFFLFSRAVYQYISVRMHDQGMSLAEFVLHGQIASASSSVDLTNLKWTAISLAVVGLAGLQTPGWNAILLPQFFGDTSDVTGRELDLLNPILSNLSGDALDFCVFNTSNLAGLTVGQTESGFAAMNEDIGIPVSLTLMDFAFNTSTAGVLPLGFDTIDVSAWFGNTTTIIPWSLLPNVSLHDGISATSKMIQQGFSADVACTFQDLKPDTTPSLVVENTTLSSGTAESAIISLTISSNCAAPRGLDRANTTTVDISSGDDGSGSVLMIACGPDGSDGSYKLVFYGTGLYDSMQTMMCTLAPKITQVRVKATYGFTGGVVSTRTIPGRGAVPDTWGLPGLSAVTTISNMMYFAQGVQTNIMGDQVRSMATFYQIYGSDGVLRATESYLRGVTEYSGSVFRACLSAKGGGISPEGVPQNMTTLVDDAEFTTQFFGWDATFFAALTLLPGTAIAFATLFIVYKTWQHRPVDRETAVLAPNDTMHIVSASAAGNLGGVLGGTEQDRNVHIAVRRGLDATTGRERLQLVRAPV